MEIKLKDTETTYTIVDIDGNKHDLTVDLADVAIQDAYNESLAWFEEHGKDATVTEQNAKVCEFLHTAFGDDQYAELKAIGGTNVSNSNILYAAFVKDFNAYNEQNSSAAIFAELGI